MGSEFSLVLYGRAESVLRRAAMEAFDELRRIDELLSNYRIESDWSEINRRAHKAPVQVVPELFSILRTCADYYESSHGAFDLSVGGLMRVWGFYKGSGRLPAGSEISRAMESVGWDAVELNEQVRTVRFRRPGLEIDPGGIGKGYAVDRMVEVLRNNGIECGLISASGSTIYAIGAPPGETGWHVEIKNPRNTTKSVTEVTLKNESLSTSGAYEKFFEAGGQMYSHIMDPRTGFPAAGMLSVSVLAPRAIDSEAWTKPLFINGRKWASKHMPPDLRAFFCEDKPNKPCAWLQ